jgi:VWFA-related protein
MIKPSLHLLYVLATISLAASSNVHAQQAPSDSGTIQANTRLILIDVTVQNKAHQPVHGLKAEDFQLLEDKVPQRLRSFEEHSPVTSTSLTPLRMPKLLPGMFTNYTPAPVNSAVNVLLLDALNTPQRDQSTLRKQLLGFVRSQPPGYPTIIFTLNYGLTMLQGTTSDPKVLEAALLKKDLPQQSATLNDSLRGSGDTVLNELVVNNASDPVLGPALAKMAQFEQNTETERTEVRARQTLDALNSIARYLSGIPGRKNLIWFSGSFPINPGPSGSIAPDHLTSSQSSAPSFGAFAADEVEFRETINLLSRSQIAVYPIDDRGLFNASGVTGTDAVNANGQYARRSSVPSTGPGNSSDLSNTGIGSPGLMGSDISNNAFDTNNGHTMMDDIAQSTGGRAYYNANNLAKFANEAIQDGSSYYTLAYSPSNTDWNGFYRKIQVTTEGKHYTLSFRRGYYADDPDHPAASREDAATAPTHWNPVVASMRHGAPEATQIIFTTRISPVSASSETLIAPENIPEDPSRYRSMGPFRRYLITDIVDIRSLKVLDASGGLRQFDVEFVTFVLDNTGRRLNQVTTHVVAKVTPDNYTTLLQKGVAIQQQVSVPAKGEAFLRIGTHDLLSNRIGTVEIPAADVASLPPAPLHSGK